MSTARRRNSHPPAEYPRSSSSTTCAWDALGYAGHPHVKTPKIDRIANEGVNFRNAFCTTSLCSPSRASLLSGVYAHKHGVTNNFTEFPAAMNSFPKVLQQAGYATAYVGKYHMGENNDEPRPGFDYFVTHKGQGKYFDTEFNFNGERREVRKGYYTTVVTDIALDWLQRDHGGKPWMMILGHKATHSFYTPEPKYEHAFDDVEGVVSGERVLARRQAGRGSRNGCHTWHGIYGPLFEWRKKFPDDRPEAVTDFENMVHAYWSTILSVDDSVGRLRAWLEDSGQLDNTIVVFVGDNGLLEGEHGMVDKRTMHEPSIRIPMAVRYAGLTKDPRAIDEQVLTDRHGAKPARARRGAGHRRHRRPLVGEAGARGRSSVAQELVLLLQLRKGIPLYAERARHPDRGVEVRALPAGRRLARQAPRRALRPEERSGRAHEPRASRTDHASTLERLQAELAEADGGDRADAAERQDATRRGHQERVAGAEYSLARQQFQKTRGRPDRGAGAGALDDECGGAGTGLDQRKAAVGAEDADSGVESVGVEAVPRDDGDRDVVDETHAGTQGR